MKKYEYKYALHLYRRVHGYITEDEREYSLDEFAEVVVSFCTLTEKILKIKLYKKNPILIFHISKFKEEDPLIAVVKKIENSMETLGFTDLVARFGKIHKRIFSDTELEILRDIYRVRNEFIHSYKPESQLQIDKEDVTKKMGAVWVKLAGQAAQVLGDKAIRTGAPKKLYTEFELEKVLEDEVRAKIKANNSSLNQPFALDALGMFGPRCPRCNEEGFSKKTDEGLFFSSFAVNASLRGDKYAPAPSLYKCAKCGLELTEKEYEIAKRLKK